MVGVSGGGVVIMRPPRAPMPKEQAIALAAWILVLSGASDEEWDDVRYAVESA